MSVGYNKRLIKQLTRKVGKGEDKPERLYRRIRSDSLVCSHYKPPRGYDYSAFSYKGIPLETLCLEGSHPSKVVLMLHGGAFVSQTTDFYRRRLKHFADSIGALAVLPDYGVMPANAFPLPLSEILIVWDYLCIEHKPENIVVVGDSAGASLALSLTLSLRDQGRALPRALVCISPWIDMSVLGDSYYDHFYLDPLYGQFRMPSPDIAEELRKSSFYNYCGDTPRNNCMLSPIYADYSGFPMTFITVGNISITESDSIVLAEKMRKVGVNVTLEEADGQIGAYAMYYNKDSAGKRTMKHILEFLSAIYKRRVLDVAIDVIKEE